MTTNGTTHDFPLVVFDTTLQELLQSDLKDGETLEAICQLKPNSDRKYGEAVPLSNKYIIHSAQVGNGDDLAHLQLENCSHLLLFFAGHMDVIFLGAEGKSQDSTLSQESIDGNAKRSFGVIQESQRPVITTYANVDDILKDYNGSKIRWGFAMDFAEQLPYLFHPELIYKLNSKRWLAVCPLKSANDSVIDCEIECPTHKASEGLWYYGGDECKDCSNGVEKEIKRVLGVIKDRKVPFVLKLTQSLSSVGTEIIKTEDAKSELLDKMKSYLQEYLPRITKHNAHLYTTSLVLSDFIQGETAALNFYIRRDGSPVFLGACHQLSTGESGRQATAITYADQEKLKQKYQKSLEKIGKVLNEEGYYGPVGADIMENPDDGTLFVIDLNVRMPLSLVLYALKSHFTNHGHGMSMVYECIQLKISREELEDQFANEFKEARIVLLGGTRLGSKEQWAFGMMVAGENKEEIDKLSDRILEFEAADQVEE